MSTTINNIPTSAPGWRNVMPDVLQQIVDDLSSASYHYAAEQPSEATQARAALIRAAEACAAHNIRYWGMDNLYRHTPQLVAFEQFVDEVIAANYRKGRAE